MNKFNLWSAISHVDSVIEKLEHVKGLFENANCQYLVLEKDHNDELLESAQKLSRALKNELREII